MRTLWAWFWAGATLAGYAAEPIQYIEPEQSSGSSKAVIVEHLSLVHTGQLLPEREGKLVSANLDQQLTFLLDRKLPAVLKLAESEPREILKLNFYLAPNQPVGHVQRALASHFPEKQKPSVSYVTTALPLSNGLVALDAVAVSSSIDKQVRWFSQTISGLPSIFSAAAVLPAGPKLYLSGMADTNRLEEATTRTLQKMMAAIGHFGLGKSDVVQLKAFLQPMVDVEKVKRQISFFFGGATPPLIFVEWNSPPPNPPIEIELIAGTARTPSKEPETVTFLTPPGTTGSKVFSRVARVNRGRLIYFSGFYGSAGATADQQANSIFHQIGELGKETGTDFQHLIKATYYVTDEPASNALNEIRPRFFNPERPPAASKAKVSGVGLPERTMTIDMIAVRN